MKKLSTKIAVLGLLLTAVIVNGCASTTATNRDAAKAALNLGMPTAGKSKVVFVRPSQFIPLVAKSMSYAIHDDDKLIGILRDSTYFVYECDDGHHLFSCSMGNTSTLAGDLLSNRIYYVRVRSSAQFLGGLEMDAIYPASKKLWAKMPSMFRGAKEITITPDAIGHDETGITNYMERVNKHLSDQDGFHEKILPEYGQTTSIFEN